MVTTRKKTVKSIEPKWEWSIDEFDSKEELEEAIIEAIFDQVLDDDDAPTDPMGTKYDVEVTVALVPRVSTSGGGGVA